MWTVDKNDFKQIESWGLEEDPFKAISDISEMKKELRWLNPENRKIYLDYFKKRMDYIKEEDFDKYYRTEKKPIDKVRWEFLKKRKAWYIIPLGWDKIVENAQRVIDLGCGDGDVVQRFINFADQKNKQDNIDRKLNITAFDLNFSRIENAKKLVSSPNPSITFDFLQGDIIGDGLKYKDQYFDYALCTGVLEILDGEQFNVFIAEMCRVTRKGIYIEDLFEDFPGGYPRSDLDKHLATRKFNIIKRHVIFSEPFDVEHLKDPKKLWPIMLVQNIFAVRC